jgi:hypothetical protein
MLLGENVFFVFFVFFRRDEFSNDLTFKTIASLFLEIVHETFVKIDRFEETVSIHSELYCF